MRRRLPLVAAAAAAAAAVAVAGSLSVAGLAGATTPAAQRPGLLALGDVNLNQPTGVSAAGEAGLPGLAVSSPPDSPPPPATKPPTVSPTPPGPTALPPTCAVRWQVSQAGLGFSVSVTVTNLGPTLNGWTLFWSFPGTLLISNGWNARIDQYGQDVTASNEDWNPHLPANGSVNFGFQGYGDASNLRPTAFWLNNSSCANA